MTNHNQMKTKLHFIIVLSLFIWAGTYAQQPVAHWTFDHNNASDTSGNNFDGNVNKIHFRPGINCDSAAWFNGVDSYVHFGDVLDTLFTGGTFSISLWAYPEALKDSEGRRSFLISKWFSSGQSSNAFILSTYIFQGINKQISFRPLPLNTWSHIIVSVNNGNVKIYINGDLVAQDEGFDFNATGTPLKLGSHINNEYRFKGGMDDVRIYATSLTDTMVNQVMQENIFYDQYISDVELFTETEVEIGPDPRDGFEYGWNTGAEESKIMVKSSEADTSFYTLSITSPGNCTLTDTIKTIWYDTEDVLISRWSLNDSMELAGSDAVINKAKTDTGVMCSQSFDFNGTDAYISLGDTLNDVFTLNDFSLSLWAFLRDTVYEDGRYSMIISKWNTSSASDNSFILYVNAYYFGNLEKLDFEIPELNTWHHFLITKKDSHTKLYIDNKLVNETINGIVETTDKPLMLAAHYNNNYNFDGKIDEIKVYNIAASHHIVEKLYKEGKVQPLGALEDKTVSPNETITLDAGPGYDTYHWSNGSTGQMYTLENIATNQQVSVLTIDDKGCYADSVSITVSTVGIKAQNHLDDIKVGPLPADNSVNITFQNNIPQALEIINLQGKVVQTEQDLEKNHILLVNNFKSGIYLMKFYFETHTSTLKFIKY